MKQPLPIDPVDVVLQARWNDFYSWVCHQEGQVLCCELCLRVYHTKCMRQTLEPEGNWFCPECEKIAVAESIKTQNKAMAMLTIGQLSYLLKFAIQKMKQPGVRGLFPAGSRMTYRFPRGTQTRSWGPSCMYRQEI